MAAFFPSATDPATLAVAPCPIAVALTALDVAAKPTATPAEAVDVTEVSRPIAIPSEALALGPSFCEALAITVALPKAIEFVPTAFEP